MWTRRAAPATPFLVLALASSVGLAACSISASSGSLSESSGSSAKSSGSSSDSSGHSSDSSSGGDHGDQYAGAVREYAASYARTGGPVDAFQRGLGDVARRYGVTDWEARGDTYAAIGQGLAQAKVQGAYLETLITTIAGDDLEKQADIRKGYSAVR